MKLHLVHDARGRILAAVSLTQDANDTGPRPVAGRGQRVLEVEVPAEHAHQDLLTICQSMRVHARSRSLVLAKKSGTSQRRTATSVPRKEKRKRK
jgi:hypothetical protein